MARTPRSAPRRHSSNLRELPCTGWWKSKAALLTSRISPGSPRLRDIGRGAECRRRRLSLLLRLGLAPLALAAGAACTGGNKPAAPYAAAPSETAGAATPARPAVALSVTPASRPAPTAVVTAGAAPAGSPVTTAAGPAAGAVTITGFAFAPTPLRVAVGATVTWTNGDPVPHTVTADNGDFPGAMLDPGAHGSATFTAVGSYDYHCAIHPFMHGMVIVGG